jgi:hypothetical protein
MPVASARHTSGWFQRRQQAVDHRIHGPRCGLPLSFKPDPDRGGIHRIEANLDGVAGQMRRSLVKPAMQHRQSFSSSSENGRLGSRLASNCSQMVRKQRSILPGLRVDKDANA